MDRKLRSSSKKICLKEGSIMEKLTLDEIRLLGKSVAEEYDRNGWNSAREKADKIAETMILSGNNDKDSRYEFEKHSGLHFTR